MKTLITNYTFDSAASTIKFNDYKTLSLDGLLLITNTTDNIIIYNFADPSTGAAIAGNTVSLGYDTSSMSNSDSLQIYYDDGGHPITDESIFLLRRIVKALEPSTVQDSSGRQKIVVDTLPTLATLTTCGTVTTVGNMAALGGVDSRFLLIENARNSYSNGIRSKLTFS